MEEKQYQLSHSIDSSAQIRVLRMLLIFFLAFGDSGLPGRRVGISALAARTVLALDTGTGFLLLSPEDVAAFRLPVGEQLLPATGRKFLVSFAVCGISPTGGHRGHFSAPTYSFAPRFDR